MSRLTSVRAAFTGSVRARMTLLYGGVFTIIAVGVLLGALRFQVQVLNLVFSERGGGSPSGKPYRHFANAVSMRCT